RVLELGNPSEAISNLDEDEKGSIRITDGTSPSGGNPNFLTVSESGLYALIFRSRKPEAKRIRKWVTSEVLPAIRKSGGYALPAHARASSGSAFLRDPGGRPGRQGGLREHQRALQGRRHH
ncbi:MAG: Bro-N domain-containing protein, partial [Desulfovibrio sp.]|nr:Bro-N domain-containing protein [Desulfovibrio sp.]